jgi:hypothetical protein
MPKYTTVDKNGRLDPLDIEADDFSDAAYKFAHRFSYYGDQTGGEFEIVEISASKKFAYSFEVKEDNTQGLYKYERKTFLSEVK